MQQTGTAAAAGDSKEAALFKQSPRGSGKYWERCSLAHSLFLRIKLCKPTVKPSSEETRNKLLPCSRAWLDAAGPGTHSAGSCCRWLMGIPQQIWKTSFLTISTLAEGRCSKAGFLASFRRIKFLLPPQCNVTATFLFSLRKQCHQGMLPYDRERLGASSSNPRSTPHPLVHHWCRSLLWWV